MTTELTMRQAIPVHIGTMTLYCESFKTSAVRSFSEEASVTGNDVITSSCPRAAKITFSGRVCNPENPINFVRTASSLLRSSNKFNVAYRGLIFKSCSVQSFTADDRGEDFISVSITLVSADIPEVG